MGKPADYQLASSAPAPGHQRGSVPRLSPCPWWPRGVRAQRQRRQVLGWQASSQGAGAPANAFFQAMIQLTGSGDNLGGVLITGCAACAKPPEWRGAFQRKLSILYWHSWPCGATCVGLPANRSALPRQFPTTASCMRCCAVTRNLLKISRRKAPPRSHRGPPRRSRLLCSGLP